MMVEGGSGCEGLSGGGFVYKGLAKMELCNAARHCVRRNQCSLVPDVIHHSSRLSHFNKKVIHTIRKWS